LSKAQLSTLLCQSKLKAMLYDAVNLAQGFPDFPAPAEIKRAAQEAIAADINDGPDSSEMPSLG
jgi:aspartate/methionine/tyrosine aminotransferase